MNERCELIKQMALTEAAKIKDELTKQQLLLQMDVRAMTMEAYMRAHGREVEAAVAARAVRGRRRRRARMAMGACASLCQGGGCGRGIVAHEPFRARTQAAVPAGGMLSP